MRLGTPQLISLVLEEVRKSRIDLAELLLLLLVEREPVTPKAITLATISENIVKEHC